MRITGYIRAYRGYDLFRDDDVFGAAWYAAPSDPPRGGLDGEALAVYPDEASLCGAIDATFEAPPA